MDEADQEKTSFITSQGLFCYKVMPFGLKNAGATYQRLVNHMFRPQIGQNVEVYVDDMLVKSIDEGSHLDDLQETFETVRRYKMKLNPSKCAFGVVRKVSGVHGLAKRNRGESRQYLSHIGHGATEEYQGSPIPHWTSCCFEQVCFESHRQMSTFLQSPQEGIQMDGRMLKGFPRPEGLSH